MFRNYVKTAIRNLLRNKLTSFINIFGLGLSMSVGLMILVRTLDAFSFDRFHPQPDLVYRVLSDYKKSNGEAWRMASTPLPLEPSLAGNDPAGNAYVTIYPALKGKATAQGKELYMNAAFTDPALFTVFGFKLLKGNKATALKEPKSLIISRDIAERYFGDVNVLGKTIHFDNGASFLITGVLAKPPGKTHLHYDAYASSGAIASLEASGILPKKSADWFAFNAAYTYVRLSNPDQRNALTSRLNGIAHTLNAQNKEGTASFELQSLNDISPGRENLANDNAGGTSFSKIYIEAAIALLILLAACFNYTNLTIARALTRAREVGVRKIVGAKRVHVFMQYLVESVLLAFLALAFAWVILALILRWAPFNDDYEFIPSSFHYNSAFVTWTILYTLFAGLLAGTAPAWILSAFKPLRVLKNLSTAKILGRVGLQKTLIVFQYSLSLVFIIFLFAFYKQFSFMAKVDPGFRRDNVLVVPLAGQEKDLLSAQIQQVAGVRSVSASSANFDKHFSGLNMPVWLDNKANATGVNYYFADAAFIRDMHFHLLAGSNFPDGAAPGTEQYIMLNEQAARAAGFADAAHAVGQKLWVNDSTQLTVVGVLRNFNYENPGIPIFPLAFRTNKAAYDYLYVQTDNQSPELKAKVSAILDAAGSTGNSGLSWLSEDLDRSNSQSATISLLGFLGFIALAVASLGLLGLVVYTTQVRSKELSIRKVVGASTAQLVNLLSKGFIKLLFIAGLIAMPIGWFLSVMFLQNFSRRISFGWGQVLLCFAFLLAIGLFTVLSRTIKAAQANPAGALGTE